MLQKNLRTIDEYKRAGAEMRLFKTLGSKLAVDISGVLSAQDSDKLLRALNRIDEVCLPPHLLQQYGKIRHESKDAAVPDGTF